MSSNNIIPLKRKIETISSIPIQPFKSQRHSNRLDDDIIRSRLVFEGDQGSDDRRISTLIKIFDKSIEIEKCFSLIYSIEHSYRLLKSTIQMDEYEQICYEKKSQSINEQIKQLRSELIYNEERLIKAKEKRFHLLEYDQCINTINKLGTRKELRTQQVSILERKHYFEHLQQIFEANYQQRLKQIVIYMRPIFELDQILQQDIHEDEQQTTPILSTIKIERPRTYSDSSITSLDGDENILTKEFNQNDLGINSLSISLSNNSSQPLFVNDIELYGTQLVNPLLFMSSSLSI